jgi:hypothetical protein
MKFLLILISYLFLNKFTQAQIASDLTKHVYKNYKPSNEVKLYCDENYAIVYLKVDAKGNLEIISSADTLGKLIVPDLDFLKGYHVNKPNTTLGLFFVIQNIESCTESEKGFNKTSEGIINLIKVLEEKERSVQFIYHPIIIKIGFNVH